MSNERYLIISYFGFAALCLGLGVLIAQILRKPFEAIVDATVGARNKLVKRTMTATLISAGVLGFLGYSYNQKGCISYQQVIQNRQTLVDANVHQVHRRISLDRVHRDRVGIGCCPLPEGSSETQVRELARFAQVTPANRICRSPRSASAPRVPVFRYHGPPMTSATREHKKWPLTGPDFRGYEMVGNQERQILDTVPPARTVLVK